MFPRLRAIGLASAFFGLGFLKLAAAEIEPPKALAWSAGAFLIRSRLEVGEMYDDNIFFQDTGTVDDFLSRINPGISVTVGKPETSNITLAYNLDSWFYAANSDFDHTDHLVTLKSNLKWSRSTLTGSDSFQNASGIFGQEVTNRLDQGVVSRESVSRSIYSDNYRFSQRLAGKSSVYVEGSHDEIDFESGSGFIDYNTLRGALGYEFKALPKTSFLGELYYGQTATHPNTPLIPQGPHFEFIGGYVGARGDFTSRMQGMIKVGYESTQYSDGSRAPDGPVVEASLTEQFTRKTFFFINYSRRNNVSIQTVSQSVTADTATCRLIQQLGRRGKWFLALGGSVGFYDYQSSVVASQKQDLIAANLGLSYQVQKWLNASLTYERQQFRSDVSVNYDVNRIMLGLALGY